MTEQLAIEFPTLLTKTIRWQGEDVEIPKRMHPGCYRSRRLRGWSHDEAVGAVSRPRHNWMVGFMLPKAVKP